MMKVICGTDTLGVGVNVPIRTSFHEAVQVRRREKAILTVRDFQADRARGRKGFDAHGSVVAQRRRRHRNRRSEAKAGNDRTSVASS